MTVKYSHEVANATLLGFIKLLFRWKGSLWKLLWKDIIVFSSIYLCISLTYSFLLNINQKKIFQEMAIYCNLNSFKIPLGFVLGFYVQQVLKRFWVNFETIPWPTTISFWTNVFVVGEDDDTRKVKRTIVRYVCCSFTMTMRSICQPVKKRFPTLIHLVAAGLLTEPEIEQLNDLKIKSNHYFVPIVWAINLIDDARKTGKIKRDIDREKLIHELNSFRGYCGKLIKYDWVTIPLVYTQVVCLAVYAFCFTCLMGRYPFIELDNTEAKFPFFTFLQFIFYMAWLKVGESGMNPFGEDDDDFEANILIDNFVQECFIIVDHLKTNIPELTKDQHWDTLDFEIPQNKNSKRSELIEYLGSAAGLIVSEDKQAMVDIEKTDVNSKESDDETKVQL